MGDQRQRQTQQDEAQPPQGVGELALFQAIEGDQRHDQRHDQPDRHLVVAHGARNLLRRPAEVHDEQPLRMGESGADHADPQDRQRGGHPFADRLRHRVVPGALQAVAERGPQHRQRHRHQNRPENGAHRQEEFVLRHLADAAAGALEEGVIVLARTDAENHQQQGAEDRDQRFAAGHHHHESTAELRQRVQRQDARQIVRHVERVREVDRIDVRHPEQIAVGGIANFVQRFDQLGVGHLQLGQLEDLGVATGQQRVQQLALGAQLGIDDALLLVGQRAAVVAFEFALRQFFQLVFKLQALHAQLGHVAVQLLRLGHLRQRRHLGAQGFPSADDEPSHWACSMMVLSAWRTCSVCAAACRCCDEIRSMRCAWLFSAADNSRLICSCWLMLLASHRSARPTARFFQRQFRFALALGVEVVAQRLQLNVYFLVALL